MCCFVFGLPFVNFRIQFSDSNFAIGFPFCSCSIFVVRNISFYTTDVHVFIWWCAARSATSFSLNKIPIQKGGWVGLGSQKSKERKQNIKNMSPEASAPCDIDFCFGRQHFRIVVFWEVQALMFELVFLFRAHTFGYI